MARRLAATSKTYNISGSRLRPRRLASPLVPRGIQNPSGILPSDGSARCPAATSITYTTACTPAHIAAGAPAHTRHLPQGPQPTVPHNPGPLSPLPPIKTHRATPAPPHPPPLPFSTPTALPPQHLHSPNPLTDTPPASSRRPLTRVNRSWGRGGAAGAQAGRASAQGMKVSSVSGRSAASTGKSAAPRSVPAGIASGESPIQ